VNGLLSRQGTLAKNSIAPQSAVLKTVRKYLQLKCYEFQILQELELENSIKPITFYTEIVEKFSLGNDFLPDIVFSNETMFHLLLSTTDYCS
jgi:hypothetical protein